MPEAFQCVQVAGRLVRQRHGCQVRTSSTAVQRGTGLIPEGSLTVLL
ncbi:hypothetical protein CU044_2207 [Streptomyces sp. L-9-10]|nr:hypothetical protein CU044_2207 [Streptomyces sp. L-9-10]